MFFSIRVILKLFLIIFVLHLRESGGSPMVDIPAGMMKEMSRLVDDLKAQGITDEHILNVFRTLRRDFFVPDEEKNRAYSNYPLPIGYGQTISQPFIVAFMTQALDIQNGDKILEVGTGSGFQAAVFGELNPKGSIYTIEIINQLANRSKALLQHLGYNNIHVKAGDGYKGWPIAAPFDKIILTAAPDEIPQTLLQQLKVGGILVAPIGTQHTGQDLLRIKRLSETDFVEEKLLDVRFVPMVKD